MKSHNGANHLFHTAAEMLYRALIRTHHMTSRKKISALAKAAKQYNCAVYLKTGPHPPGIMIAESDVEESVKAWVASVKV